jgi:hypothetical protein
MSTRRQQEARRNFDRFDIWMPLSEIENLEILASYPRPITCIRVNIFIIHSEVDTSCVFLDELDDLIDVTRRKVVAF